MKKWIVVAVLVVIVAGLAWYFWMSKKADTGLVTEENVVLLSDQQPDDETVVSYAKLAEPGYVTIYGTDANGNQVVVGTSDLLPAGEHKNVRVHHRSGSSTKDGSTITAVVVADDGDGSYTAEDEVIEEADDSALVSDEAELDTDLTDEELADLLEDAGYEPADDAGSEGTADTDADDAGTADAPSSMDDGAASTTDGDAE